MNKTAGNQPKSRAEREAEQRSQRRAEQAGIVTALKSVLAQDEQLLGFARGRIAGGFRGKLNVGPEALFAPVVNIGLTERRLVLQHVHAENGRPSEILPHFFPLGEIEALTFSDIETYGAEPACRLVVRMTNQLYCRLRLRGKLNFESAETIAEVYNSLTGGRRSATTPTQRVCAQCRRMLDQPYKFCPYCGQDQPVAAHTESAEGLQAEMATPVASDSRVATEAAEETSAQTIPELPIATEAFAAETVAPAPTAETYEESAQNTAADSEINGEEITPDETVPEEFRGAEIEMEAGADPYGEGDYRDVPVSDAVAGTPDEESEETEEKESFNL